MMGSHEFDDLVKNFTKKAKKQFPDAEALIFDEVKQTHNTTATVIKFK